MHRQCGKSGGPRNVAGTAPGLCVCRNPHASIAHTAVIEHHQASAFFTIAFIIRFGPPRGRRYSSAVLLYPRSTTSCVGAR
jgi:hypothetical protein